MAIPYVFRRGTAAEAISKNPILREGEAGFEIDTGRFKIGDGETRYNDLPYFVTTDDVQDLVNAAISQAPGGTTALFEHINSLTPHPVYDDGPSLALLYANKKV